jgi:hypothetical protein
MLMRRYTLARSYVYAVGWVARHDSRRLLPQVLLFPEN